MCSERLKLRQSELGRGSTGAHELGQNSRLGRRLGDGPLRLAAEYSSDGCDVFGREVPARC